ncbi:hypothetical protein [Streptomyces venezuelae]|uniref:hypothetical protein n=1 Tax=Streptomyces venezuelae TaxID=54571 RepID=UPI0034423E89
MTKNLADFEQYAVQHSDGRWLYHLPTPREHRSARRISVLADGKPMSELPGTQGLWWSSDRAAHRITARFRLGREVVGYRLRDLSARSERFPEQLSVDQWRERTRADHGEVFLELYESVTEEQPEQEYVYGTDFKALGGAEPPSPDGPAWVAELPYTLTERPEYRHLFPGYLAGLLEALTAQIRALPHVEYCHTARRGDPVGLKVTIKVPFRQPVSRWQPNIGANGRVLKSGRNVPVTVRHTLHLPVRDEVPGSDYASALATWHELLELWTGVVGEANVRACNTCDGTGHVLDVDDAARCRS